MEETIKGLCQRVWGTFRTYIVTDPIKIHCCLRSLLLQDFYSYWKQSCIGYVCTKACNLRSTNPILTKFGIVVAISHHITAVNFQIILFRLTKDIMKCFGAYFFMGHGVDIYLPLRLCVKCSSV